MVVEFPPVELADDYGLLAIGGDLEPETLELAYRSGIFPWPMGNQPLLWFAPPQRAVLEFAELHIPRRLQRDLKNANFEFRTDYDFASVIEGCAHSRNRRGQRGTWLTPEMIDAYIAFHERGFAHSFETYDQAGNLVGGMYGVLIDRYFAGESMFYKKNNASKFALIEASHHLRDRNLTWMDVQVLSPFLARLGAKAIPRSFFMEKLHRALHAN